MAARLSDFLGSAIPNPQGPVAQSQEFLRAESKGVPRRASKAKESDRLDRLAAVLKLSGDELDLIVLAGMSEEHEGYASVFRALHPRGEPHAAVGLAAQLLGTPKRPRHSFQTLLESSTALRYGVLRLTGEAAYFERSLELAESLWPVLHGSDTWPDWLPRQEWTHQLFGLEEWLATPAAARSRRAVAKGQMATVLIAADSEDVAFHRGMALVKAAGREPMGFPLPASLEGEKLRAIKVHSLARPVVPVLLIAVPEGPAAPDAPPLDDFPDAAVICGRTGIVALRGVRPMIAVPTERLSPEARRTMWRQAFPDLANEAPKLAARYPIEPSAAVEVAADLRCLSELEDRAATVEDVAEGIRARASLSLGGGVKLIRPQASWENLVLPREREEQLRAAIARLDLQSRVLDDWGFLQGRPGARGVRMLFSGPPGTGKTLSAEVLAGALNVDLLFVDISRVVSKWIGETEKNLAAVFDAAERAQAVLFFDEADALFGRRTEVSDAHDRYANLETAYLLARLERFEGLAIMATNLRQNIDPAFLRRLEFVVDFDEPDREERYRLWRCHVPSESLLDPDVNLYELSSLYPVVGGFVRNAAVAAAFLAAADGGKITRLHFIRAIRREYEKAGKAFPGVPAGMSAC